MMAGGRTARTVARRYASHAGRSRRAAATLKRRERCKRSNERQIRVSSAAGRAVGDPEQWIGRDL
jgi:hypothetical protein